MKVVRKAGAIIALVVILLSVSTWYQVEEAQAAGTLLLALGELAAGGAMGAGLAACLVIGGVLAAGLASYYVSSYIQSVRLAAAKNAMTAAQAAQFAALATAAAAGPVTLTPQQLTDAGGGAIMGSYAGSINYVPTASGAYPIGDGSYDYVYPAPNGTSPLTAHLPASLVSVLSTSNLSTLTATVGGHDVIEVVRTCTTYTAYHNASQQLRRTYLANDAWPVLLAQVSMDVINRATGATATLVYGIGTGSWAGSTSNWVTFIPGTALATWSAATTLLVPPNYNIKSSAALVVDQFGQWFNTAFAATLGQVGISLTNAQAGSIAMPVGTGTAVKSPPMVDEIGTVAIPTGGITIPKSWTDSPPIAVPLIPPDVRTANPTLDDGLQGVPIVDTIDFPIVDTGSGTGTVDPPIPPGSVIDWSKLLNAFSGMNERFPFSIPWDISAGMASLVGTAVRPDLEFDLAGYPVNLEFPSYWDNTVVWVRRFELLVFGVGLAWKSRTLANPTGGGA